MFTKWQEEKYNQFWQTINNKGELLLSSKDRAIGKTYLLNEIGLELQALNYEVYILLPSPHVEHFACNYIDLRDIAWQAKLRGENNIVVLADEYKYDYNETHEFLKICKHRNIPIIGFANYKYQSNKIEEALLKIKYKYIW